MPYNKSIVTRSYHLNHLLHSSSCKISNKFSLEMKLKIKVSSKSLKLRNSFVFHNKLINGNTFVCLDTVKLDITAYNKLGKKLNINKILPAYFINSYFKLLIFTHYYIII